MSPFSYRYIGRRTTSNDYYAVGNICTAFDDEITLEPGNDGATINIPIRMNDLRQRSADLCSCVFEVAHGYNEIRRMRTYLADAENEFVEFSACTKCGDCDEFEVSNDTVLSNIDRFSVKVANEIQAMNESDRVLQIKGRF